MSYSNFLEINYDEFNEKTISDHPIKITFTDIGSYEFFLRHVKSKDYERLILICEYKGQGWMHLRNGDLIINCDQENIKLKFHHTETDVFHEGNSLINLEKGAYEITKEQLKIICDAQEVKIRITGKNYYEQGDHNTIGYLLQLHAQTFYNSFYDSDLYKESFDELEKDTQKSRSCFIATATMGDINHPVVSDLRSFRDSWLTERSWGRKFIHLYYKYGPSLARMIERSKTLKNVSYVLVVRPLHAIAVLFK